jgi:hypothetical protein
MKMKLIKILSLTAVVFLLTQCYPEGPIYTDELDLVYSNYDAGYDFTAKHTFAIPDKVMKIDEALLNGGGPNYVKDVYASVILNKISQNMLNNGWSQVAIKEHPDVLVAPAAFELTTYYYDYWGYYDWWYGGYYPGGGWYYPYPTVSSYSTGSLIVTMVDPNNLSPDDRPLVAWTFAVNGLLTGSTSEFNARVARSIDQAFTQSPYLTK